MKKIIMLISGLLLIMGLHATGTENRLSRIDLATPVAVNRQANVGDDIGEPLKAPAPSVTGGFQFTVGFLASPNMNDFKASTDSSGSIWGSPTYAERSMDSSSSFAIALGLGLEFQGESMDTAIMLNLGALLNTDVDSTYTELSIEPLFKVNDRLKVGPVLGLMAFSDTEWEEDYNTRWDTSAPDIEFEGGPGARYGIKFVIGEGRGHCVISITYLNFAYGVIDSRNDPNKYWTAESDELDISGLMVYIGARF